MSDNRDQLDKLLALMSQLRDAKTGCPWDQQQTFDSLVPYTIEESYEVADAISRQNWGDVKDELGDLLYQIIFYSQIGKEEGKFEFNDIAEAINSKLIRHHPHVFKDKNDQVIEPKNVDWEQLKSQERQEKGLTSILDDISASLPAMMRAEKLQKRCSKYGFDWDHLEPVVAKVHEEIDEVMEEAEAETLNQIRIEEEMGDLLFAVVNMSRHLNVNPEQALLKANRKFEQRFRFVEQAINEKGSSLQQSSLQEMDLEWERVKQNERKV
ncbi:nucleoside triphosphate pyrophosphohydrolase [Vibrio sp. SS-MA-C1-2]|uniref:nucleoside triphosphate pyrophosphohydrolase n=1 Tax=Vibrio sp. SS-MA-C1-2 TaxID=2908646 RepID=UPI001F36397D|nr:nucleoside triphosphate pyrophosphohydrolase [Vibrio sp. SS-MA-C1-2]UJF19025.1 nucleoside triphosphate pyrophosphohydrolase [Vibrio sp. SS-MA-C1-2]